MAAMEREIRCHWKNVKVAKGGYRVKNGEDHGRCAASSDGARDDLIECDTMNLVECDSIEKLYKDSFFIVQYR